MNQDNNFQMICPRCGSEMNSNSRYCMKCGYLNPQNTANQNMQPFINNQISTYQIGSGQAINQNNNGVTTSIGTNTGNKKLCFLINYLIYMTIIVLSFFLTINVSTISFEIIKNSLFPYIAFFVSILFLFIYSFQLIFIKFNRKWWYSLIPIYNYMVLSDVLFKNKWLGLICLIPFVGQVFSLVLLYVLGTKFKYNGILSMLFPIVSIPLMGFGSRLYEGINYISGENTLEKDYKRKKIFFISLILFLIFGAICIFWTNIIEIKGKSSKITNYYYVYATSQIVSKTKQLAYENYLVCEEYNYSDTNGIYYVEYPDMGAVAYFPFYYLRDVISGYVIIDNTSGSSKYYVSMSDGTYGFPETLSTDVKLETVVPYEKVINRTDINYCRNTKRKATVGEM